MTADRDFLIWIAERLVNVHGENESYDYIQKLVSIAKSLPASRDTPPAYSYSRRHEKSPTKDPISLKGELS